MKKVRCSNCKQYFEVMQIKNNLGQFCTTECFQEKTRTKPRTLKSKPQRKIVKKKPDIPADVRLDVSIRDGFRCRFCGSTRFELHHIRYRSQGGDHKRENLVAVCQEHHSLMHSDKQRWQPILETCVRLETFYTIPEVEAMILKAPL